jgi:presenilin-like A22 family membrane protease
MPADDYDVRALALPLDDEEAGDAPVWSRRSTSSFRRHPSHHGQPSMRQRVMTTYDKLNRRVMDQYNKLTPVQKILFFVGVIVAGVLGILFLIYNEQIFGSLLPVAKKWRDVRAGWLILWVLIFVVSFPPLIGYSSLLTIAGFVYGFPNGYVESLHFRLCAFADSRVAGLSLRPQPSQAALHLLFSLALFSRISSTASSQMISVSLHSP